MFSPTVSLIRALTAGSLSLALCGLPARVAASDAPTPEPKAEGAKKKGAAKADAHKEDAEEADAKPARKAERAAADGKAAHKAEATAEPKPAEAKLPKAAKAAPRDSMDVLRERLAEKLGATKLPDAHVMRVAARSPAPQAPAGHAAPAHRPARSAAHAAQAAAATPGSAVVAHAAAGHAAHWDYKGDAGPQTWGALKPEFAQCANGTRQSPIDIRDGIKVQLDAVQVDYRPSGFRVIDNGHTVQVNVAGGNSIEVQGRRYDLLQFHFHRPSEERINGRLFDMVAHLVHKDMEGRLAVIAVLLDRGTAHPIIQSIWNNLPLEKNEELAARATLDLNALLPADRSYFTYMGSLTTPPCSEGVLWMVMKNPVTISAEQIGIFARLYPMNARPIQSVSGRLIKESN